MAIEKTTLQDSRGYTNKSKVTTASELVVRDSVTKELGYADDVIPALTANMNKATDAEKDAWRLANRKSNETYSTGQPRVDIMNPPIIDNTIQSVQYVSLIGINLYLDNTAGSISTLTFTHKITGETKIITNFQVSQTTPNVLVIGEDFTNWTLGYWSVTVKNQLGISSISSNSELYLVNHIESVPIVLTKKYESGDSTKGVYIELVYSIGSQGHNWGSNSGSPYIGIVDSRTNTPLVVNFIDGYYSPAPYIGAGEVIHSLTNVRLGSPISVKIMINKGFITTIYNNSVFTRVFDTNIEGLSIKAFAKGGNTTSGMVLNASITSKKLLS